MEVVEFIVVVVTHTTWEDMEAVEPPTELAVALEGTEGVASPIELAVDPMEVAVVRDTEGMTNAGGRGRDGMPYCPDPPDARTGRYEGRSRRA